MSKKNKKSGANEPTPQVKTTENAPTTQSTPKGIPPMPMVVNAQYIKDFSFENPTPLKSLRDGETQPEIALNINVNAEHLGNNLYEVILHVSADAKRKGDRLFLLELQYGGLFTLASNLPKEAVHPLLMIECPRVLFPYARSIVANTTREGGYPALALNPIDFLELYRQQYLKNEGAKQSATAAS